MNTSLISYGSPSYMPLFFKHVSNHDLMNKPKGGLWTSPESARYGWVDFAATAFDEEDADLSKYFKVKLSSSAKVAVINTVADVISLPLTINRLREVVIDFELMAKEYDAIWLTDHGLGSLGSLVGVRIPGTSFNISFNGWDCESVLILRPDNIIPL